MKKILLILLVTGFYFTAAKACDICGCGVGSNYIGILPDFKSKVVGLRYRCNSIKTHIGAGGTATYLTTKETYKILEVWGGWNICKRFRIMATVPYNFNERFNQRITNSKNGIGDINITTYYQVLSNSKTVSNKLLIQSLWAGAGIKLPTGKYNPADKGATTQNTNLFQLGTGSADFILSGMYDIRLQDAGLNVTANYKINTANKFNYAYGNKLSTNAQAYYKFRIRHAVTLAPSAGALYETTKKDKDDKFPVHLSGGYILSGTLGMEVTYKKISAGGNWQTPLSQNLANGFVKASNRMMMHVSFAF